MVACFISESSDNLHRSWMVIFLFSGCTYAMHSINAGHILFLTLGSNLYSKMKSMVNHYSIYIYKKSGHAIIKENTLKTKAFLGHIWPTYLVDLDTIMALLILGLIIWQYWIWCCNGKIYEKPHFFTTMIKVQLKTTNLYSSQNMCYRQQNYLILYTKFVLEGTIIDMKWSVACSRTNYIFWEVKSVNKECDVFLHFTLM